MKYRLLVLLAALSLAGVAQGPDNDYQAGTRALDANRFDEAVQKFSAAIDRKSSRADGAYYWKAYALNRIGRRSAALASIAALRGAFPESRWMNDAQALELEIRAQEGRPVHPGGEGSDELKLMALNGLMQSDPAQATPILKQLLNSGNQSAGLKDRALFVLAQSGSPDSRQLLVDIAKGKANPDLQVKAIRYISMMGGRESRGELAKIYAASGDVNLKREIIRSYLMSGSKVELLAAAQGEPVEKLRGEAIRTLAQMGAKDELWALYRSEKALAARKEIVDSMLLDGDSEHLLEIVRTEKDITLRRSAINTLGLTGWGTDSNGISELYRAESDPEIKKSLIRAMFLQQNAKGLVDLARAEKNPELKREIVSQLALIHSKEATEYWKEVLK